MFRRQHVSVTGFQIADVDGQVAKERRDTLMPSLATLSPETEKNRGDWGITWPGGHANFMFWRYDPSGLPPTGGNAVGGYSYAIPARNLGASQPSGNPGGPGSSPVTGPKSGMGAQVQPVGQGGGGLYSFLPLEIPGFVDLDYEQLDIEEAGPDDWIVLSTTKHGDRRKIAFRANGHPNGLRLVADHRSNSPPDQSSIVHDGAGNSYDPDRKATLDTTFEVRHWVTPNPQPPAGSGHTVVPPPPPDDNSPPQYSIAWVGDSSPDGMGFCRIGFGDRDGLGSHLMYGPFIPSLKSKHKLADTPDGPMISLALSTNSYFKGSGDPYSAPLDFEEKPYPNPRDSTFEYKVFLWYDHNKKHPHYSGDKDGMWRWFTRVPIGETPKCSPTKDYSTSDTNLNPRRSFAEDSRAFIPKKVISTGVYLMPREGLTEGRIMESDGSDR